MCALGLTGCLHSGKGSARKPEPRGPLVALDAEQRRLVADYEPVSRKLYDYEVALRDWERGGSDSDLSRAAGSFRATVSTALERVRRDPARAETAVVQGLFEDALRARLRALDALLTALAAEHSSGIVHTPPTSYVRAWNDSIVYARKGLTKLQDIRDRARLIPIPEDSVS